MSKKLIPIEKCEDCIYCRWSTDAHLYCVHDLQKHLIILRLKDENFPSFCPLEDESSYIGNESRSWMIRYITQI